MGTRSITRHPSSPSSPRRVPSLLRRADWFPVARTPRQSGRGASSHWRWACVGSLRCSPPGPDADRSLGSVARARRRRRPGPPLHRASTSPTRDWPLVDVPGHWRSAPLFADTDGPVLYRRTVRPAAARHRATGDSSPSTASSTCGDVWLDGALPRRHRGLLLPAHLRDHRRARRAATPHTCWRWRWRARASPTAPRSGRSPASSPTGTTSIRTGTPAGSGGRSACATPARSGSVAPRAVHRGDRGARPAPARRHPRPRRDGAPRATDHARRHGHRRRPARSSQRPRPTST